MDPMAEDEDEVQEAGVGSNTKLPEQIKNHPRNVQKENVVYTAITIDTSENRWQFKRFRQIGENQKTSLSTSILLGIHG